MLLTFRRDGVEELLTKEMEGPSGNKPYTGKGWGCRASKAHGLDLVGDQGIYLICNRPMEKSPSESGLIVYARESDPTSNQQFDEWYHTKRTAFGGDDGVNFIDAAAVLKWIKNTSDTLLCMDLTPSSMSLLYRKPGG